ncbi:putative proline--tRNA ligase-like protein [Leptotrombidium deliense]|uniref:Putative proline--tRNA ligase-like protein n=1 Tax=Leptotrombidium deliense TaxID=299467 RepID=A0A443SM16_9ACAR|nr:putative proline--tRNA ligase-like protein [Leptotrombidium deliense]
MFIPISNFNILGNADNQPKEDFRSKSYELLSREGYISKVSSGLHVLLPFANRSLEKLVNIIKEEMDSIDAQQLLMPSMVQRRYFDKSGTICVYFESLIDVCLITSGRWQQYSHELFTLKDRNENEYCLAPTHEEIITSLVVASGISRKNFPLSLYQISTKFRDEIRAKFGLLRAKEFIMKGMFVSLLIKALNDLYTFDVDEQAANETYDKVCQSYDRLFKRLKLDVIKVEATTGLIGGKHSHEYHILADVGEDEILMCEKCRTGFNAELSDQDKVCRCCGEQLVSKRAIELGHTFLLGTRYSEPFDLKIQSSEGHSYVQMGCFGLGVSRILAASVEVLSSKDSIRFPRLIAPYTLSVITPKKGSKEEANNITEFSEHLCSQLSKQVNDDVLIDDRSQYTIGRRVKDCQVLGIPYIIVAGKNMLNEVPKLELIATYSNETFLLTQSQVFDFFNEHFKNSSKSLSEYFNL